jgi:hypothetical protein
MSLARYSIRTASFAALYLVVTLLGQLTEVGRTGVALCWPAAVVGALWLLAQAPYRMLRFDVIALATVAASVAVTSHGILAALALAVPQVVPAVLVVFLAQRRLPAAGAGTGAVLVRLAGIAAAAAASGAILHGVIDLGGFTAPEAGYLILRDTVSVLLALLALHFLRRKPDGTGPTRRGHLTVVR